MDLCQILLPQRGAPAFELDGFFVVRVSECGSAGQTEGGGGRNGRQRGNDRVTHD